MPVSTPKQPHFYDYLAFYVGVPVLYGAMATPFATRPMGIDYWSYIMLVVYVSLRTILFWTLTDLSCRCIGHGLSRYRLPLWVVFCIGFVLSGTVLILMITLGRHVIQIRNPDIAPFVGHESTGLNLDYIVLLAGYTVPILMTWFGAAYGYMRVFNVRLFSYARTHQDTDPESGDIALHGQDNPAEKVRPLPAFLAESRLPANATVLVIRAEEHYIRIWTDCGTDLLRYRFKDAVNELEEAVGLQVHRSWWVRLSCVGEFQSRGKKMDLMIDQLELTVPVSLSYKQALIRKLKLHGNVQLAN